MSNLQCTAVLVTANATVDLSRDGTAVLPDAKPETEVSQPQDKRTKQTTSTLELQKTVKQCFYGLRKFSYILK